MGNNTTKDAAEGEQVIPSLTMVFDGAIFKKQDGSEVSASDVTNAAEVIAVYFSAHWCPPCRSFTPLLKAFYEANKDKGLVIIFVSSDRSSDDAWSYFTNDHGDYYMLPHGNDAVAQQLKDNCGVQGIPMLAIVDKGGNMKHKDGRGDVGNDPDGALALWKSL